jgi:hypothetical protein
VKRYNEWPEDFASRCYPPVTHQEVCKWCNQTEAERIEKQLRMKEAEEKLQSEREFALSVWKSLTLERIGEEMFRCLVCCRADWKSEVPSRYNRYNCCSERCKDLFISKMEEQKRRLEVLHLEDKYVVHLLGGITTPSLITAKRINVKMGRFLKENKKTQPQKL